MTREQAAIWFRLGPVDRSVLELLRQRKSDKMIRNTLMMGQRELLFTTSRLREILGVMANETIRDAATRLNLPREEEARRAYGN